MIKISNVAYSYTKKNVVYQNLAFELTKTGVYGLLGSNGSGKSTLLKLIAGLLFAKHGEVTVLGSPARKRLPEVLAQISFVPEEFHFPDINAIEMEKYQGHLYPKFSATDFYKYIEVFDVPKDKKFSTLSLGQKKKAVLAFYLATHTPILLMDEPTNGLDIVSRAQFQSIMRMPEQQQRLVIISTHQARDLEKIMDHLLYFDKSKLKISASMTHLKSCLKMGVGELNNLPSKVIYQEVIGTQAFYLAEKDGLTTEENENKTQDVAHFDLELLYKAINYAPEAVFSALNPQKGSALLETPQSTTPTLGASHV